MCELQILVIGNAFDAVEPDLRLVQLAEEVGHRIAESGATLMFGGETRVGSYSTIAGKAARAAGGISIAFVPGGTIGIREPEAATAVCPLSVDVGGPREALLSRMGEAVIVIGGGSGTATEALSAYQNFTPLICLQGSGGWADRLLEGPIDSRSKSRRVLGVATAEEAVVTALAEIQRRREAFDRWASEGKAI